MKDASLHRRLIYAALTPAARLAARMGVGASELGELDQIAYYREARRRGMKMREIQELLDISSSTAARLSKKLSDFFSEPHAEHGVGRRILNASWAEPLTRTKLGSVLDDVDADELDVALDKLLDEGRLEIVPGRTDRYRLTSAIYRFTENAPLARFEALNSFLVAVSLAIEARFLDEDERALVRTNRLRVRDEDFEDLKRFYEETVHPFLAELDARVDDDADSTAIRFSILWSPDE